MSINGTVLPSHLPSSISPLPPVPQSRSPVVLSSPGWKDSAFCILHSAFAKWSPSPLFLPLPSVPSVKSVVNGEERPPALSKLRVAPKPAITGLALDGPSYCAGSISNRFNSQQPHVVKTRTSQKRRNHLDGLGFNYALRKRLEHRAPEAARAAFSARNEQPRVCRVHKIDRPIDETAPAIQAVFLCVLCVLCG